MTLPTQSVRAYLAQLEARGWLKAIAEPVDPKFELSAYLCHTGSARFKPTKPAPPKMTVFKAGKAADPGRRGGTRPIRRGPGSR